LADLFFMAISHRGNDRLFVFKVAIDQANADARLSTDVVHAGLVEATSGEAHEGGVKDLGPSVWDGFYLRK